METPCKILILVLFTLTLGEAKDERDILIEVKEIMMEWKEKVTRTEDNLAATKAELADIKAEQAATKAELANTKKDLNNLTIATKEDMMMLEKEVTIIREPPYIHTCGSHYEYLSHYHSQTLPYSTLLYSATNTEGGGLDISSGIFTAPWVAPTQSLGVSTLLVMVATLMISSSTKIATRWRNPDTSLPLTV